MFKIAAKILLLSLCAINYAMWYLSPKGEEKEHYGTRGMIFLSAFWVVMAMD